MAYITDFREKQRVGLAFLRGNGVMMLVPPGAEASMYCALEYPDRMCMIGVFGNS